MIIFIVVHDWSVWSFSFIKYFFLLLLPSFNILLALSGSTFVSMRNLAVQLPIDNLHCNIFKSIKWITRVLFERESLLLYSTTSSWFEVLGEHFKFCDQPNNHCSRFNQLIHGLRFKAIENNWDLWLKSGSTTVGINSFEMEKFSHSDTIYLRFVLV